MNIFRQNILSFSPLASWYFLAAWLLFCLLFTYLSWQRFRDNMPFKERISLLLLRLLSISLISIFLLQPMLKSTEPEAGSFRIAILADHSRSMEISDRTEGETRFTQLYKLLKGKTIQELAQVGELEFYAFSEKIQTLNPNHAEETQPMNGTTDFAKALEELLDFAPGAAPLGTVIMLSDGNDSGSKRGTQLAKQFLLKDIPISTVGIGKKNEKGDIKVKFTQEKIKAEQDKNFSLSAELSNSFNKDIEINAELLENGIVTQRKTVKVQANNKEKITFECSSAIPGFNTYAIKINSSEKVQRTDNKLDFISVEVEKPDEFSVLYLSANLNWEWRFLRIITEKDEQINLSAIIKTGEENFFRSALSEAQLENLQGFPDTRDFYATFDAVILDSSAASLMSSEACEALEAFVDRKGGGLLFTGNPALLPENLLSLLPVKEVKESIAKNNSRLLANTEIVFDKDASRTLQTQKGIILPAGTSLFLIEENKTGAREALNLAENGQSILSVQSYGAGRSAYLGTLESWRWRLALDNGENLHSSFWHCLLVWLSERQQPQLQPEIGDNLKLAVDEEALLKINVMGTDFLPAADAEVNAIISNPQGEIQEIILQPSFEEAGLYSTSYSPKFSGEHKVQWQVKLPNRKLSTDTIFLARQSGAEMENTDYDEEILRDIARITNGQFFKAKEFAELKRKLPLSTKLPTKIYSKALTSSWIFLILSILTLSLEWTLRRRLGLK